MSKLQYFDRITCWRHTVPVPKLSSPHKDSLPASIRFPKNFQPVGVSYNSILFALATLQEIQSKGTLTLNKINVIITSVHWMWNARIWSYLQYLCIGLGWAVFFTCLRLHLWACCGRSLSPLCAGSMGCRRCCQQSQPQSQVEWRRSRACPGSCYGPRRPDERGMRMIFYSCSENGMKRRAIGHGPRRRQMLRRNHTVRLSCCQPDLQRRWG